MKIKHYQESHENISQLIEKAQNQSYEQGKTEGFALGLTRGEFKTRIEIAKIMAENDIDFSTIAKCVKLPVSKIKKEITQFDNSHFSYSKANYLFSL